jgi:hypothetical protein
VTEDEWLTATDPMPMLRYLRARENERSRRLFECACCRRVWRELTDRRSRQAVEVAEDYADGLATDEHLEAVADDADKAWPKDVSQFESGGHLLVSAAAYNVALPMGWWGGAPAFVPPSSIVQEAAEDPSLERIAQVRLLRDIVGNPFHLVAVDAAWLTPTVVALADAICADRAFDRMPVLADALEEAGCDHPDVLSHCRGDGPHVRGCWVVDLVLGKG